uniref:Putative chemosensory protein n=1 Tax=Sesamia inferens TaxID=492764 RepID=U5Q2S7_SESIF|nr:putative chemosensory protein [Sesamia inferens]
MMYSALATMLLIYLTSQSNAMETSTYTTKYDGIDLDEILNNERLLNGYVNCLMDLGPCTADGKELKKNIPDAIENDCKKCTDRQRDGSDRVMHYLIDHRPDDWVKLEKKYNSDGSYKMKYLSSKPTEGNSVTNVTKSEEDTKNDSKE